MKVGNWNHWPPICGPHTVDWFHGLPYGPFQWLPLRTPYVDHHKNTFSIKMINKDFNYGSSNRSLMSVKLYFSLSLSSKENKKQKSVWKTMGSWEIDEASCSSALTALLVCKENMEPNEKDSCRTWCSEKLTNPLKNVMVYPLQKYCCYKQFTWNLCSTCILMVCLSCFFSDSLKFEKC